MSGWRATARLRRAGWTRTMLALTMAVGRIDGAAAQEAPREPVAIVEIGTAAERSTHGGPVGLGPSLAVEATPIEGWLEVEAGVAPLFSRGQTEWDLDLLFKKPFTLSRHVELMVGAGPSLSHVVAHGRTSDAAGVEGALDLMVWPGRRRRFGWFVEPSYGYSLAAEHERTLGISLGLLVPIR